ncbi:formyltetrahydrofolate deformylase [Leucothrix arctica]|uniref:Formyltetrahydrofolate deformylase n=1 Tax=Leucothrix arctica TaxID=1481894 RepID=A0A317CQA3_9GAMM|nr:formyltetrahydrofolate deformylase [Leucothrix arctica]PWQ98482.1 formyltetrahydrofolate deformylase [Leucothrix arctica]
MLESTLSNDEFIFQATCPLGGGIVSEVSSYLWDKTCYIKELHQFDDLNTGEFFMRAVCRIDSDEVSIDSIREGFGALSDKFGMTWDMHDSTKPCRVLIMVSKLDHCLDDLLYRHRKGELAMDITAIVSNHQDVRPMAEREGIRFVHLPITKENKAEQEAALLEIVDETNTDLVVLARYMQILSDKLSKRLSGKVINIHHSFLPGFKGAKPYHQAFDRGVKLIGATAHYVTADLDEGPIIEQAVQVVDHSFNSEMLTAAGRDTETIALAKAVKYHVNHRVFMTGNKTVVFK